MSVKLGHPVTQTQNVSTQTEVLIVSATQDSQEMERCAQHCQLQVYRSIQINIEFSKVAHHFLIYHKFDHTIRDHKHV